MGLSVAGGTADNGGIQRHQFATCEVRMLQGEHGELWERRILSDQVQFLARLGLTVDGAQLQQAVGVIQVPVQLGTVSPAQPGESTAWRQLALELFPDSRGMNAAERTAYQDIQRRLFKPSGKAIKRTR